MIGKVVCVTGGSGYIASWLVKLLLLRGYHVRATLRSLNDPSKVDHLKALEGAKERLQLFEADLVEQGSFDDAINGCDGVFHTASPVILGHDINDPKKELIEPAIKGTLNVLSSCLKAPSIKRVILTSSMAAVMAKRNYLTGTDVVIDETWFSDAEFCEETEQWYVLSKTLAEEAARKFAQENGIDLVVINPGLVIGPLLQPTLNSTSDYFLSLVREGKMPGGMFVFVDVRDVAYAHVVAYEDPSANGRYCVVAKVLSCSHTLNILQHLYPTHTFPKSATEVIEGPKPPFQISNERAKTLGLNFISVEESIKDTIQSLIDKNLFSFTI